MIDSFLWKKSREVEILVSKCDGENERTPLILNWLRDNGAEMLAEHSTVTDY